MSPPIKDLLPRLTPILRNRHEKVLHSVCVYVCIVRVHSVYSVCVCSVCVYVCIVCMYVYDVCVYVYSVCIVCVCVYGVCVCIDRYGVRCGVYLYCQCYIHTPYTPSLSHTPIHTQHTHTDTHTTHTHTDTQRYKKIVLISLDVLLIVEPNT